MPVRSLFIGSALVSVAIALLHVYVIAKGPSAYRFFGAGERMATLAEQGSWLPAAVTSAITLAFLVFAAYYLAGAGLLPPPPLFRAGVAAIAAVYVLRGLAVAAPLFGARLSPFEFW